jgi:protein-tyrosine kinase
MGWPEQMSLIDRAWQQLSRNRGGSIVERAVEAAAVDAATGPPETPIANGTRYDAIASASYADRRSQEITIDLARLAARGFITPQARSRLSEEIKLVKHQLMQRMRLFESDHSEKTSSPLDNVIMVTSARPSEGKSFVSLNLALSFVADEGLNVLLVDADPVQRSILSTLNINVERGLVDLLRDPSLDMANVLLRDAQLRFSVLPGGSTSASVTELFSGQRMRELMTAMAARYRDRIIIFDCPPVLASTEPLAIAQHVGQLLFVVEANGTPERAIRSALDLLSSCRNVSFVLNKTMISGGADEFGAYYTDYDQKRKSSRSSGK